MIRYPEVFWLFLVLLPYLIISLIRYRTGKRDLKALGGKWREARLLDLYTVKWFFSFLFFSLFIVFTILALSGFQTGSGETGEESNPSSGDLDIVFTVDVSRSMLCGDILPSRLERSAVVIGGLIEHLDRSKYGITVFKGESVRIIPLTEDIESIHNFLGSLDTELLTSPGSNIENGINGAINSFTKGEERRRVIILFSDGEPLSGNIQKAAERAKQEEIVIYTVGAGTSPGGTIPLADGTLVTDNSGNIVVTRLEKASLEAAAGITGGEFFMLSDPAIYNKLAGAVERGGNLLPWENTKIDLYRGFLIAAVLFLLSYFGVRVIKWKDIF